MSGVATSDVAELTALAAQAKTKVKRHKNGWSMVTLHELIALAWFADLWLQDLPQDVPAAPAAVPPETISDL